MSGENIVDVDPQAIEGELLLKGEGPQQSDAQPNQQDQAQADQPDGMEMDWRLPLGMLVGLFANHVAPNWQVSDQEQAAVVDIGAKTLAAFFPDVRIEGKWAALTVCCMTVGGVVMSRFDVQAGKLRPLRVAPEPATDAST